MTIAREPHYVGQHVSSTHTSAFSWTYQIALKIVLLFFDPQNIGLKTCYTQLSLILAELWRKIDLPLMAAIFCAITYVRHIRSLQE